MPQTIADFTAHLPNGETISLADRLGKVLLVVNTASKCGFTPQYDGLEKLWRDYGARGFEVIAFPCNQFGGQEPGSAEEIGEFCRVNFGLSFPLMAKVEVNGPDADPLWNWLKDSAPGILGTKKIKWNFTKFLIGRDGRVVRRFAPNVKPEAIAGAIENIL
ncbi:MULTISPECIES: glutathione peroxidase [unclassified Novosphingobium]|uniref:glutathione peroxidase n=1 Tax=unclassified Novosphingobium TaxID=2644732 RepID=UPI00086A1825|nr:MULTISPECIES: glutathione peroxidase [unclassified Novosphingobium]MBN9144166.1 glutathione peroxidase [Novosphingobium sp.]MDR6708501.1 glutathione peroxidase [Novosphingobium sp. 1748]NKJ01428.1 glutathione peroxidase [Novosphingobium sp. SG707]ODU78328.1 MAG: glutathione peroxidase [Novosphingobium sp. SCN 63-17]OJX95016.1 MAG: glutathione peroxidase [Novosphingobium sp. 63-713]